MLISFHVLISCLHSFTGFQSFLWSLHTWQVEGLGVRWRLNTNRAGEWSFTALPVSGLKAHGRAAGALGNHIDLALTDTCREREVWGTGEERSPIPSAVSSSARHSPLTPPPPHHLPHRIGQETSVAMPLSTTQSPPQTHTDTHSPRAQPDWIPSTAAHNTARTNLEPTPQINTTNLDPAADSWTNYPVQTSVHTSNYTLPMIDV